MSSINDGRIDQTKTGGVTKERNDRLITACEAVLETKMSVQFKSGSVVVVYDPVEVEALTALMTSFVEAGQDQDQPVIKDTATAATAFAVDNIAKECCYCHKPATEGIVISHGDFLCVICQHDSPLSVYYTNSR